MTAAALLGDAAVSISTTFMGKPINATKLSLGWEVMAVGQPVLVIGACRFMVEEINFGFLATLALLRVCDSVHWLDLSYVLN